MVWDGGRGPWKCEAEGPQLRLSAHGRPYSYVCLWRNREFCYLCEGGYIVVAVCVCVCPSVSRCFFFVFNSTTMVANKDVWKEALLGVGLNYTRELSNRKTMCRCVRLSGRWVTRSVEVLKVGRRRRGLCSVHGVTRSTGRCTTPNSAAACEHFAVCSSSDLSLSPPASPLDEQTLPGVGFGEWTPPKLTFSPQSSAHFTLQTRPYPIHEINLTGISCICSWTNLKHPKIYRTQVCL